jgi:hypothetical protein
MWIKVGELVHAAMFAMGRHGIDKCGNVLETHVRLPGQ